MENKVPAGRYAPSPSGPLHVGNLRTALAAWAWARSTGRRFLLRIEDIDPHRVGAAEKQLRDLERLGVDWDEQPLYQSGRFDIYDAVLDDLQRRDFVFECYCSRKDIREAASAPHSPPGHYPGTCTELTKAERETANKNLSHLGRTPALRLRPKESMWSVRDYFAGQYVANVDAFVLRRSDGGPAYNLAAVVDDALSGVDQVVRGDDLLPSAPGQAYLASLLGNEPPVYGHVPLVLNPAGRRLAKRDGAVTLDDLVEIGWEVGDLVAELSSSLGAPPVRTASEFLAEFDPANIPRGAYQFEADTGLRPS